MSSLPADIANQSLDAAGIDFTIGDLEEGTRPAQVLLRAYGQCLRQLLRAVHWNFARKQAPMVLLADSTGQTPDVGTVVQQPWRFAYVYPEDCMKARFVPWNQLPQGAGVPAGNIQIPATPIMTGLGQQPPNGYRLRPAPWLEGTDFNYPPLPGQVTWEGQGVSPQGRTVIMTNVENAYLVYTALMLYPSVWDALFRAALVSYLASEIAMPLAKDKKFALQLRAENIKVAKEKIHQARQTDGNEMWASSDIPVDWMAARVSGGPYWGNGAFGGGYAGGFGSCVGAWSSCGFADGSAY